MKKFIALLLAGTMVFSVAACSSKTDDGAEETKTETETTTEAEGYEIALITDVGNIDDKSFNQGTWEGVVKFAEDNGKTYAYYRPSEDSTEARLESISAAIEKGAKVVVCPGYLFEDAIYTAQDTYPDVQFLLLDGEPHTADNSEHKTADNTHCILYREEQAGYLAGYAAVMDGYRNLGFCGGMDVPAVMRYGYGFVQGADAAAAELGEQINIKYWYSGAFSPSDDTKNKMSSWYTEGTEIVFACGGGLYLSVVAAAEAAGAKVIGVDVDQSAESELIVTSAMKELANSTILSLGDLYANDLVWPEDYAGKTAKLGAAEGCVGLPTAEGSWRFENFTVDQYDKLFADMVAGTIEVSNDTAVQPATTNSTVDYQE